MLKARDWRQWRTRDHVFVFGPALLVAVGRLNVDAKGRALVSWNL